MSDTTLKWATELDASGFASGAQNVNSQLGQMGLKTGAAQMNLGALGTVMGTLANPMTGVALAAGAVGAALAASVSIAGTFQSSMARVASVSGASAADMQRMSDAAREAGATSVFSASQAADAMYFLASSGMSVNDQISSLNDTLLLASAGGLELARSGEIMTGSLAQFALAADQSGRVANLFAATSAASNTDVTQLGDAMKEAGPMANAMGMSIEETSAALAIFANANIKGSQAGTGLKSILGSMSQETKLGAAALSELGLTYDDISLSTHTYGESMMALAEAGMTADQAIAIFGKDQASVAITAVNGATGNHGLSMSYDELKGKISDTDKATQMSKQMTDNYEGSMKAMSSALEEAGISLGIVLLPALTEGVKGITGMILVVTELGKELYSGIDAWNAWIAAGVGKFAKQEQNYETKNQGHYELIGEDAIWVSDVKEANEVSAKEIATQTAGIYGDYLAKGIGESKAKIAETTKDVLGGDAAKEAAKEAAEDAAKAYIDGMKSYLDAYGGGIAAGYNSAQIDSMAADPKAFDAARAQAKAISDANNNGGYGYDTRYLPQANLKESDWSKDTEGKYQLVLEQYGVMADEVRKTKSETLSLIENNEKAAYSYSDLRGETGELFESIKRMVPLTEEEAKAIGYTSDQIAAASMQLMFYDRNTYAANDGMLAFFDTSKANWEMNHKNLIMSQEDAIKISDAYTEGLSKLSEVKIKTGLFNNWVGSLKPEVQDAGKSLGYELWMNMEESIGNSSLDENGKNAVWEDILGGLANADWSGLSKFVDELNAQVKNKVLTPEDAKKTGDLYRETLLASVTDMKAYTKDLSASMGKDITEAFSDNVIGTDDQKLFAGMIPQLELIKERSPQYFADAGLEADLQFAKYATSGASAEQILAYYKKSGLDAGTAYKDALTGASLGSGNQKSLIDIVTGDRSQITNLPMWRKNVFQPMLETDFGTIYDKAKSYYADDIKLMDNWFSEKQKLAETYSGDFENWQLNILNLEEDGRLTTAQAMEQWKKMLSDAKSVKEEAQKQKDESKALFYEEIRDTSKTWQDYMNADGGFVGPTVDWYKMKIEQQSGINDIASLKKLFNDMGGESPIGIGSINQELEMAVVMDTSTAAQDVQDLTTGIQSTNPEMSLLLNTNEAYTAWGHLVQDIEALQPVMRVQVEVSAYADEIRAQVDSVISEALAAL